MTHLCKATSVKFKVDELMSKKKKREPITARGVTYEPLRELAIWLNDYINNWPDRNFYTFEYYKKAQQRYLRRIEGQKCKYCKRPFTLNFNTWRTVDHIIPISKGGRNIPENKHHVCRECNQWKDDRTLRNWRKQVSELNTNTKLQKRLSYTPKDIEQIMISLRVFISYAEKHIKTLSDQKIICTET